MPGSCNSSVQCALGVKQASYVGYLGSKMFKGKRNEVKRVAKISKAGYCQDFLVQRGNRQLDTMPSRNVSEGRGCCQNFQPNSASHTKRASSQSFHSESKEALPGFCQDA